MARHRFGGTDGYLVSVLAEGLFDSQRLQTVVVRRRGTVSIDVTDLLRSDSGVGKRRLHSPNRAVGGLIRCGDMEGVARHPVAGNLRQNRRATLQGEVQSFQ